MIFYDLETTGVDVMQDRIIEIYALKIKGDEQTELHYILNPGIPIPPDASAVHGYTDEDVREKPLLGDVINEVEEFFAGEDLIGYNNRKFDNLLLNVEFTRHDKDLRLDERNTLDIYEMWTKLEPRNLGGAYKRFCNEASENLHGAKEDVKVVSKVYDKMLEIFSLQEKTFEDLSTISSPDEKSLCFGKLLTNDNGELVLNFGNKHPGKTIRQIQQIDPSFLDWILNKSDMDSAVKYYIFNEVNRLKKSK